MKTNTCYVAGRLIRNGCDFTKACEIYTHKGEKYFLLSKANTWVFNNNPIYNDMCKEKQLMTFETLEQALKNEKPFVFKVRMQGDKIRKYLQVIATNPVDTESLTTSR
jgi:hypothetical protein